MKPAAGCDRARRRMLAGGAGLLLAAAWPGARAQDWPKGPIRLVVPFPAGGTPDAYARALVVQLQGLLGQTVVVDNRAGANGIIGMDAVAKAPADGSTFLYTTLAFAINPSVHAKLPFDVRQDFAPVTNVASGEGYLLLLHPSVAARSLPELIALARTTPLAYASAGIGNSTHLAAEMFALRAGVKLIHVPYKGLSPAIIGLIGGEVQLLLASPTAAVQHVRSGRLRALAYTGAARWPQMPDLPTVAETLAGYEVSSSWHGLFAPARTPSDVVARMQAAVAKAVHVPALRALLLSGGYEPVANSPADFQRYVDAEIRKYAEIVRAINLKPE